MSVVVQQQGLLELDFKVTYNTITPPTVDEVIQSLKSLEFLLKKSTPFLTAAFPGLVINDTDVYVEDIEAGSLKTFLRTLVSYSFDSTASPETKEKFEKAKAANKDLAKSMAGDIKNMNNFWSHALAAVVAGGLGAAVVYSSVKQDPAQINHYNTTITNSIVNSDFDLSEGDVAEILDEVITKDVAKEATKFVQPAKADAKNQASISIGEFDELELSKQLVETIPVKFDPKPEELNSKSYSNAKIFIYASDQDKRKVGWAGVVPEIFSERVKFKLSDDIDPHALHGQGRKEVKADLVVWKRYDSSKRAYVIDHVFLERVNL